MDFTTDIVSSATIGSAKVTTPSRKKKAPEKKFIEKNPPEKKRKTSPPAEESSILKTFPLPIQVPEPPALEVELEKVVARLVDHHFSKSFCHACKKH